jgi:hypothetical protein
MVSFNCNRYRQILALELQAKLKPTLTRMCLRCTKMVISTKQTAAETVQTAQPVVCEFRGKLVHKVVVQFLFKPDLELSAFNRRLLRLCLN